MVDTTSFTNQTVTVHLHRKYRILEHGRLNWVVEPVLNTEVNKSKILEILKKKFTRKNPTITGEKKKKIVRPPKFDGGNYLNWLVQVTFNLKL